LEEKEIRKLLMMHKTRNKRKLFLLAVLTIVTVAVFWWIQPENRIDIDQQVFQVEDLSRISRVDLESDSASVSLSYDGGRKYDQGFICDTAAGKTKTQGIERQAGFDLRFIGGEWRDCVAL
jgi:hypothetical protein